MGEVADNTGGRVCVNNNDLAKCVNTAISDGTSYYELGYYPDSSDWHGEFHQVTVKAKAEGFSWRTARDIMRPLKAPFKMSDNGQATGSDPAAERAACEDVLVSTRIVIAAKILPNKASRRHQVFVGDRPQRHDSAAGGGY